MPSPQTYAFTEEQVHEGYSVKDLFALVNDEVANVKKQLQKLKDMGDQISIAEMFQMQMMMNHLSQLSEMSTDVVQQSNTAIQSMARNIKG